MKRLYFRKKKENLFYGILDIIDDLEGHSNLFSQIDCDCENPSNVITELSDDEVNNLIYADVKDTERRWEDWEQIEETKITPADLVKIGLLIDGKATVKLFELPGD